MLQQSHQISSLISAFLWRPYLSVFQSSKPPWVTSFCKLHCLPTFIKETRHTNGKGRIIVIIIVNNEPWEEGTTMRKSWLKPTCYSKRSRIIVIQGLILTHLFMWLFILLSLLMTSVTLHFWDTENSAEFLRWIGMTKRMWSLKSYYSYCGTRPASPATS